MKINTIVVSDADESNSMLEKVLSSSDYKIVFNDSSLQSLLKQAFVVPPELIIINIEKADLSLIEQLKLINQQFPLPVVVFAKDDTEEAIEQFIEAGVSAYVVDGLSEQRILPILKTAVTRFRQYQGIKKELKELKTSLDDRKIIDRAKGILMQQRSCTEDEAYKLLRSNAMSQNTRIAVLAKNLVDTADLLTTP